MGVPYTQPFSLTNNSNSTTKFSWSPFEDSGDGDGTVSVSVLPKVGALAAHETKTFQLTMCSQAPLGHIPVSVECTFDLAEPVVLFAEAHVQGAQLRIEEPLVDYGLVQLDHRVSYNLTLSNMSEIPANWLLTDAGGLERDENERHIREFFFVPPHGCIAPHSSDVVTVCFKPSQTGSYTKHIELHTEDNHTQFLKVNAMVQTPKICLNVSNIDLKTTYLGVQERRVVEVRNLTMLPTHFMWDEIATESMEVWIEPQSATLKPAEAHMVTIGFTPQKSGQMEAVLGCSTEGMSIPLGLGVKTCVETLEIQYGIDGEVAKGEKEIKIDFGDEVPIFVAQKRVFLISNKSAIPAKYTLTVQQFPANLCDESREVSRASERSKSKVPLSASKTALAPSTMKLGEALMRAMPDEHHNAAPISENVGNGSSGQLSVETMPFRSGQGRSIVASRIRQAQEQTALAEDHGVAFGLSSQSDVIGAWETVEIEIMCYSNMSGQYSDVLHCQVADLAPKEFKITAGVRGSPISLDPTCVGLYMPKDGIGKLTFEPVLTDSPSLSKTLVLLNAGPFDLAATLQVVSETRPFKPADVHIDILEGKAAVSVTPHHLQPSTRPFEVQPQNVVIPSKGKCKISITFHVGSHPKNNDHCLIVNPVPKEGHPDAELPAGFLPALYANLSSVVLAPSIQTVPKRKLHFDCVSSDSMDHISRTRIVTLKNSSPCILCFTLKAMGPFTIVHIAENLSFEKIVEDADSEPAEFTENPPSSSHLLRRQLSLKPMQSLCVHVKFVQEPEEEGPADCNSHHYTGGLEMHYSNEGLQQYPLSACITYPACSLSVERIDFGIVRIGTDKSQEIIVTAETPSTSTWSLTTAGSEVGAPPRRGSVSMGRRASVTGVAFRRSSLTMDTVNTSHDPFTFNVQSGFYESEVEFRFFKNAGEIVSRRQKAAVGGWLAQLTTAEAHEFYDLAAGKALIPRAPWGQQILNWVCQFATAEVMIPVKESVDGSDTFSCVFLGVDLAEWFELRKEAICAGELVGKPPFLKQNESQVRLKVSFTPTADEHCRKRYEIRLEHGRKCIFVVEGQGTSDEEMLVD